MKVINSLPDGNDQRRFSFPKLRGIVSGIKKNRKRIAGIGVLMAGGAAAVAVAPIIASTVSSLATVLTATEVFYPSIVALSGIESVLLYELYHVRQKEKIKRIKDWNTFVGGYKSLPFQKKKHFLQLAYEASFDKDAPSWLKGNRNNIETFNHLISNTDFGILNSILDKVPNIHIDTVQSFFKSRFAKVLSFRTDKQKKSHKSTDSTSDLATSPDQSSEIPPFQQRQIDINKFSLQNSSDFVAQLSAFLRLSDDIFTDNQYFSKEEKGALKNAWKENFLSQLLPAFNNSNWENFTTEQLNEMAILLGSVQGFGMAEVAPVLQTIKEHLERKQTEAIQRASESVSSATSEPVQEPPSHNLASLPQSVNTSIISSDPLIEASAKWSEKPPRVLQLEFKNNPNNPVLWLAMFDHYEKIRTDANRKDSNLMLEKQKELLLNLLKNSQMPEAQKKELLSVIERDAKDIATHSVMHFRILLASVQNNIMTIPEDKLAAFQKAAQEFSQLNQFLEDKEYHDIFSLAVQLQNPTFIQRMQVSLMVREHIASLGVIPLTPPTPPNNPTLETSKKSKEQILQERLDAVLQNWEKRLNKMQAISATGKFIPVADIAVFKQEIKNFDLEQECTSVYGH